MPLSEPMGGWISHEWEGRGRLISTCRARATAIQGPATDKKGIGLQQGMRPQALWHLLSQDLHQITGLPLLRDRDGP
ncbi:unnamed protein product [Gadus morhua 'NCC']